ncbi:MAG: RNA-binding S4 domain-containing protein, partial [Chryseobacterium sp.]|nr:RNA-binding S4 domain-containing protein [Chryseobacterium sp.]
IEDKTDKQQYEILKLRKSEQDYYRIKGEGRPTKKDRREIDDYVSGDDHSSLEEGDWDLFFSDLDDQED